MKRFLFILLCLTFTLSVTSCRHTADSEEKSSPKENAEEDPTEVFKYSFPSDHNLSELP